MSTGSITFAGLSSGIDVSTLISTLVSAEKEPETAIQTDQSNLTTQISTLGSLVSKIQALGDAATALDSAAAISAPTATSSSSSTVSATADSTAVPGTYNVVVGALATAQTNVSTGFASDSAGVAGAGTLTIAGANGTNASITYSASDSLSDIAARINSDSSAGSLVQASVINDGSHYRLVLTATQSGVANGVTYGSSSLGLDSSTSQVTPAGDASFSVNGVSMTRPSNDVSDVIKGVTLSLGAVTQTGGAATKISVAVDTSSLQQKAQTIVDAYNSIASLLHGQMDYQGTALGANTLYGDTTVQGLRQQLAGAFATAYGSGSSLMNASALGIETQSDGTLAINATKFQAAVSANPNALQQVLLGDGSSGGGLVGAIGSIVTDYTQYGTGALVTEQASKQGQITADTAQISRIDDQANSLSDRLSAQFAALDALESTLQSQQSYVSAMFSSSSSG